MAYPLCTVAARAVQRLCKTVAESTPNTRDGFAAAPRSRPEETAILSTFSQFFSTKVSFLKQKETDSRTQMKTVGHALAFVGAMLGASFMVCAGVAWLARDATALQVSFLSLGSACLLASVVSWFFTRGHAEYRRRDAMILVVITWVFIGLVGALPYLVTGTCSTVPDAIFESFSGFTTTGASVLTDLEQLPHSVLFWRSMTHFLGGVGILIMFIAILPFVGAGGVQLYKAEATGLFDEKLTARIADTARIIVGIYVLLNVLCTVALRVAGLSWFDAVCHAFGAIATGGFSTRTNSIGAFANPGVEWIIIAFMLLSGLSFVAHYHAMKGKLQAYWRSSEIRFFIVLCGASIVLSTAMVWQRFGGEFTSTLRTAAFQTVSLFSTTGYTTTDYEPWPNTIKLLFLVLMVIGACAGSTSGAIKSVRVVVVAKLIARQFRLLLHPSMIQKIRVDGESIEETRANKALSYIVMYLLIVAFATLVMTFFSPDILTAVSAVIACLGGVGPGMSAAGPSETYAQFPAIAKLFLVFTMLLGRLEIYSCLALFVPSFWKR